MVDKTMGSICPKCGMPKEICVCQELDKQGTAKIKVYTTKAKFKKLVTIVEGIDQNQIDETAKILKQKLACGGTAKEGMIVLQGNHVKNIEKILKEMGYPSEVIEVEQ
ncbi:MAG: stress response translation initiation inhibitor YciH [Candidatus Bilamarchaeaceae archaeon]